MTPTKGCIQDPNLQHNNDPPIKGTIDSYPPKPSHQEFCNQNDGSANVKLNEQAEEEQEEIELQCGKSNDARKQTSQTWSETSKSDFNTTNNSPLIKMQRNYIVV